MTAMVVEDAETELGAADTTPDNLYMIGTFSLAEGEALIVDFTPPDTRYWSVTLENIWHECIDHRRRRSSLTNAHAVREADGTVRIVIAATNPGMTTGSTPATATAASSSFAGSTTPPPPP